MLDNIHVLRCKTDAQGKPWTVHSCESGSCAVDNVSPTRLAKVFCRSKSLCRLILYYCLSEADTIVSGKSRFLIDSLPAKRNRTQVGLVSIQGCEAKSNRSQTRRGLQASLPYNHRQKTPALHTYSLPGQYGRVGRLEGSKKPSRSEQTLCLHGLVGKSPHLN